MKRTIAFLILSIMLVGTVSCNRKSFMDDIPEFSYDSVLSDLEEWGGLRGEPNFYVNKTETKIKSRDDVIELAKKETSREYDIAGVNYDKSSSMWRVFFNRIYGEYQTESGIKVYIDKDGITKLVTYEKIPTDDKDVGVTMFSYENQYRESKKWCELGGYTWVDPSEFKNTTETEIKTKEDAVALAKNELLSENISEMYMYYDKSNSMWFFHYYLDNINGWHYLQFIFIDDNGITRHITHNIPIE